MVDKLISFILVLLSVSFAGADADFESAEAAELHYTEYLTLVAEHPHNAASFTQGLFFYGGEMYESTGRYNESKLYKNIDIQSGKAEKEHKFADEIFAEGSVVLNDKLYVLTYKENEVQVFNPHTLEHLNTYDYPRQGWGLTTDGKYLIASDGTEKLYFMDESLDDVYTLNVTFNGTPVKSINELEYINGEIWANVWLTEEIIIIDPTSGSVTKKLDFSGLYQNKSGDVDDVLNGIAYNSDSGRIYITGKRWDKIYEFEIVHEG